MPLYRVLRFQGSLLSEIATLEAADSIEATLAANALSTTERIELWLHETQVAVLLPSRSQEGAITH